MDGGLGLALWLDFALSRRCAKGDGLSYHIWGKFYRLSGRDQETHRVSPAPARRPQQDHSTKRNPGQRLTRRARSARLGAGRALAGGFGPRLAWRQRGDVAGAMAPANKTALEVPRCDLLPPLRAGSGNAPRFPRPCTTPTTGPFHQAQPRPAPGPAGVKRPPWGGTGAGRGLWPPAGLGATLRVAGAMAPAMAATQFPRPLRDSASRTGSAIATRVSACSGGGKAPAA
jgi:hypothetical protein